MPHGGANDMRRCAIATFQACCLSRTWLAQASVQELFGPLTCGGVLLLAAPGGEKDTQYLARLCKEQRVSCIVLVPSALEVLMQACPQHAFLRS